MRWSSDFETVHAALVAWDFQASRSHEGVCVEAETKMRITVVEFTSNLLSEVPTLKPYPCRLFMWIQPE